MYKLFIKKNLMLRLRKQVHKVHIMISACSRNILFFCIVNIENKNVSRYMDIICIIILKVYILVFETDF